jgi:uncharacterized membrane protein YuzA (DUF378 family)
MNSLQLLYYILLVFVLIGGINWGIYAMKPSSNLVEAAFGTESVLSKIIFTVVAFATIGVIILTLGFNSSIFAN